MVRSKTLFFPSSLDDADVVVEEPVEDVHAVLSTVSPTAGILFFQLLPSFAYFLNFLPRGATGAGAWIKT